MVRIRRRRGAEYTGLLADPTVERWYRNVARGSQITADVYLRRLGNVCETHGTTPAALVTITKESLRDLLADIVSEMEEASYYETVDDTGKHVCRSDPILAHTQEILGRVEGL